MAEHRVSELFGAIRPTFLELDLEDKLEFYATEGSDFFKFIMDLGLHPLKGIYRKLHLPAAQEASNCLRSLSEG